MLLLPLAVQVLEAKCFLVGCLQLMDMTIVRTALQILFSTETPALLVTMCTVRYWQVQFQCKMLCKVV